MTTVPCLYTYPEAATKLRAEERWLRRNIRLLPHTKLGRDVRFTEDQLARIVTLHEVEPTRGPLATAPPGTKHPAGHLRPLPRRRTS